MSNYWIFRFRHCLYSVYLICATAARCRSSPTTRPWRKYDIIPQRYLDQVKAMWVSVAGESHSSGYRKGCLLLQGIDPTLRGDGAGKAARPTDRPRRRCA